MIWGFVHQLQPEHHVATANRVSVSNKLQRSPLNLVSAPAVMLQTCRCAAAQGLRVGPCEFCCLHSSGCFLTVGGAGPSGAVAQLWSLQVSPQAACPGAISARALKCWRVACTLCCAC